MGQDSIIIDIKDLSQWEQLIEENLERLLVIDLHKDWCGPTVILHPTFKRIYNDLTNPTKRLLFVNMNEKLEPENLGECKGCKPCFIFYRNKQVITTLMGADAPKLESLLKQHIPPDTEED